MPNPSGRQHGNYHLKPPIAMAVLTRYILLIRCITATTHYIHGLNRLIGRHLIFRMSKQCKQLNLNDIDWRCACKLTIVSAEKLTIHQNADTIDDTTHDCQKDGFCILEIKHSLIGHVYVYGQ